jgi:catechol 2,3-dioxygenase-like lactoylglutathione lyase family enzyme
VSAASTLSWIDGTSRISVRTADAVSECPLRFLTFQWACVRSPAVLRIGSIVLRVDDLQLQTEFWQAALGYVRRDDGESDDFVLLGPPDGVGPHLSLDQVRSTLQIPPRLHLDLYTDSQANEVERLTALGATDVHWDKRPPDADYVILADPEGNRFCVVDTAR